MNVGSLFAGIGGFDLGFERAGMRTLWQVEIDPFCRRVLERHFPDAERYADVREVGAHNLAPVDVVCGGFPCQDISLAGRGAGIDGERSGLWSEMWRVIRELEPRWVVVENVPALTSRGLDRVLRDLAEGGYDAEWDCLPASAFGAPHRRDRVWIVAYPAVGGDGAEVNGHEAGRANGAGPAGGPSRSGDGGRARDVANPERIGRARRSDVGRRGDLDGQASERGESASQPARCDPARGTAVDQGRPADDPLRRRHGPSQGSVRPGRNGSIDAGGWSVEPALGRVADGFPGRVEQLRALGNALVPQIAEWIGRRLMEAELLQAESVASREAA